MAETTVPTTETRQRLHTIVRKEIPFEKKARELLEVGAEYLDVDCGYLTRIDTERDEWEVVITTDSEEVPAGRRHALRHTYCRETVKFETHYALHDVPAQEEDIDPAIETTEYHTYFGVPLIVDGDLFGTACFVAKESRSEPFSDVETWFIEHLTGLLERELARDQLEAELTSTTNLATVLNRVLRHNLRNDVTVIRGYTEYIAEQLDDQSAIDPILSHVNDLIKLSQKARELQQIITAGYDRRRVELGDFIEGIASTVAQEHPDASISVEYDSTIHVDVLSNFGRAIEEFIENAVKHSGDSPTTAIEIEAVSNAVEIRISDNGPGLPRQEVDVLTGGEETPLAHGSGLGLWLAYWIVTSHDGSIDPEVTANGTTITISLPRKPTVGGHQQLTELSRSRDKYKAAFDEAADAMVIADEDGQFIEINDSASELFGVPKSELLGRTIAEFASEEFDFDVAWQHFLTADKEQGTFQLVRPDGTERVVEYAATPDIVSGEHLSVLRDVTPREARKRELTALKERYETLLEAAPDPVFVADAETGEIIETNAAAETMLGKSRADIVGQQQSNLHPSDQAEQYRQLFEEQVHSGGPRRYLPDGSPIYVVTNDGERIPVEISVGKVSLPNGPVAFGIFRDITERNEQEQRTRRLKERLDLAIEAGRIGVWEWEIGSNAIRWDESMERLLGMEPGTFPETWDAFTGRIHPDDLDRVESEIESALAAGDEASYSFRIETAGGEYRWIETRLRVLADANGEPLRVLGVGIDVTDDIRQAQ